MHTITVKQGHNLVADIEHRPGNAGVSPLGKVVESGRQILQTLLDLHKTQPQYSEELGQKAVEIIKALTGGLLITISQPKSPEGDGKLTVIDQDPLEILRGVSDQLQKLGFQIDFKEDDRLVIIEAPAAPTKPEVVALVDENPAGEQKQAPVTQPPVEDDGLGLGDDDELTTNTSTAGASSAPVVEEKVEVKTETIPAATETAAEQKTEATETAVSEEQS